MVLSLVPAIQQFAFVMEQSSFTLSQHTVSFNVVSEDSTESATAFVFSQLLFLQLHETKNNTINATAKILIMGFLNLVFYQRSIHNDI